MPRLPIFHLSLFAMVFALAIPGALLSQYEVTGYTHYTYRDGLSDDFIKTISQDERGYLWIGTDNGINRFDGSIFTSYFQDAPPAFLYSSQVNKVQPISDGRIAIVTNNQTALLNVHTYQSQSLVIPDTTSFSALINAGWDFLEVPGKGFAVSTAVGFSFYNTKGDLQFRHEAFTQADIGQKRMLYGRDMLYLPDGRILIYVEDQQQAVYDIEARSFRLITTEETYLAPLCRDSFKGKLIRSAPISSHEFLLATNADSIVYYDFNRRLRKASPYPFDGAKLLAWPSEIFVISDTSFILTGGELGFFHCSIDRETGVIRVGSKKYFASYWVNDIFLDREGRLWIGTNQGLFKENLSTPFIHTVSLPLPADSALVATYSCYWTSYSYKGKLYLGRYDLANGLVIMDPASLEMLKIVNFPVPIANAIYSIHAYANDTLWLGTAAGTWWYDIANGHYGRVSTLLGHNIFNYINILSPTDRAGNAWLSGLMSRFVVKYNPQSRSLVVFDDKSNPSVPFEKIKHVVYDADGHIWIGGHSLARYNITTEKFDTLMTSYGGPNKYNDDIIMMKSDAKGNLWIINVLNGLLQYKTRDKQWVHYGLNEGIPSSIIQSMSDVIDNELWLFHPHHVSRFNVEDKTVVSYDQRDGLLPGRVESRYMTLDSGTSRLFLLINDAIAWWNIAGVPQDLAKGQLVCQQIKINDGQLMFFPNDNIRLRHNQNDLELTYAVIDFEKGPAYQFAYRLEDGQPWTELGEQRKLFLTNLTPGEYSVSFKARSLRGEEQVHRLQITVNSPFWRTAWFSALVIVCLAGLGVVFYRRRISDIRARANIDNQLSQAEMKALHAQMNPHFIFNSLNSIRKLVLNNENHEASRYLGKFAQLIRMTLDQSRQNFISLRQTVEYLQRYVELEKIRNANFTCAIEVDPVLDQDDIILPPMLIQPFVENAIWHGISPDQSDIIIHVRFAREGDQLVCTVEDNGIGINESRLAKSNTSHNGVGIENIQSRIALLNKKHNLKSDISLIDKSAAGNGAESGTRVVLRLPLEMSES